LGVSWPPSRFPRGSAAALPLSSALPPAAPKFFSLSFTCASRGLRERSLLCCEGSRPRGGDREGRGKREEGRGKRDGGIRAVGGRRGSARTERKKKIEEKKMRERLAERASGL